MHFHINKIQGVLLALMMTGLVVFAIDEYSSAIDPMLDTSATTDSSTSKTKVTAVYGVNTEDYLPLKEEARRQLRPNLRESNSHPAFDLPDAFYFIGGPLFLLILLRVLSMFLNEFEENRRAEQRVAASEELPDENWVGE